jgi:PAS domain S-box-containing protein
MRNLFNRLIFVFLIIIVYQTDLPGQEYQTDIYTIEDGLPSSTVYDIAQDSKGRIWFATRSGICVYDGIKWISYGISDGLPHLHFYRIAVDEEGIIWATEKKPADGILFFDGKKWDKIPAPEIPHTSIQIQDLQTAILNGKNSLIIQSQNSGIFIWCDKRWIHYGIEQGLPTLDIRSVAVSDNIIFLATDQGLITLHNNKIYDNFIDDLKLPSKELFGIAVEPQSTLITSESKLPKIWFCGKNWVGYYENNNLSVSDVSTEMRFDKEVYMQSDLRGSILIGNSDNIFYVNTQYSMVKHLSKKNGFSSDGTNSIFVDREKNVWFTSDRGVTKFISMRFANYRERQGLLEDEVSAVNQFKSGEMIFGHNNGITIYDGKRFITKKFIPNNFTTPKKSKVLDLKRDWNGYMWAAVSNLGLAKISSKGKIYWYFRNRSEFISSVLVDKRGNLWAAGVNIIYIYNGLTFKKISIPSSANSIYIRKIFESPDGTLYFTTKDDGIFIYKDEKWQQIKHPNGYHSNNIYSNLIDSNSNTWVGALDGLYTIEADSIRKYSSPSFSINRPVYVILEDEKKNLWFGTDIGVVRWDGTIVTTYNTHTGLAGLETNRSGGFIDNEGRIWIGTDRGVSCYQEKFDNQDIPEPQLELVEIEVSGHIFPADKPLELDSDHNNIVFRYNAISFVNEHAMKLRMKLDGLDNSWMVKSRNLTQEIQYTNLPPGSYQLHLQVMNAQGAWSQIHSSPIVYLKKPYWKNWWFYALVIVAGGLFFFIILYLISMKRYYSKLERQVNERTVQLRASEEKYRTLIEDSLDTIYMSSLDGKFQDINPAGVKLLQYGSKEELLKIDITRDLYVNPEDRQKLQKILAQNHFVKNHELQLKTKYGEEITVLLSTTTAKNQRGEIIGYRGIIRDVTEQKQLEQQFIHSQKMESIGMLAGGIAHDFNNILAGILGYASLLKLKINNKNKFFKEIDTIEKSASRAAELTNQLLAFARGGKYSCKPININKVIKDTIKIIRPTFDKSIEIKMDLFQQLPTVEADSAQIQQIIMNICVNARDAMPNGGILRIESDAVGIREDFTKSNIQAHEGLYAMLSFIDNGDGMDSKMLNHIFEPFYTKKKNRKGNGLGLAMVYGIVKNHGGFIKVNSKKEKGTTFKVFLPVSGKEEIEEQGFDIIPKTGDELILVVDDEESIRSLLQAILENSGYKVLLAENGLEAVSIFNKTSEEIKLVILDMMMPKMGGKETFLSLKEKKDNIKVIISTGYSKNLKGDEISGIAVKGFIQKPYRVNELLTEVRKVLDLDC